jgi:hypothetical protein
MSQPIPSLLPMDLKGVVARLVLSKAAIVGFAAEMTQHSVGSRLSPWLFASLLSSVVS